MFYVYVIGPDSGFPCKVGVAMVPEKRLAILQASHWERLYIYEAFRVPNRSAAYRLEGVIHHRLRDNCIRGEWFNLLASDVIGQINSILEERFSSEPLIYKDKRERRILKHVV